MLAFNFGKVMISNSKEKKDHMKGDKFLDAFELVTMMLKMCSTQNASQRVLNSKCILKCAQLKMRLTSPSLTHHLPFIQQ